MKKLRVKVLERVIKHTIRGDKERAAGLMEKLMAAIGSQIVNESMYGGSEDPMFPARRELQRELEADIEQDRVEGDDLGMEDETGALDAEAGMEDSECDAEAGCDADAVATMIADLVKAGGVDEDKLAQIVDIIIGQDAEPVEDELGVEDDLGDDELPQEPVDPALDQEAPTEDPLKL